MVFFPNFCINLWGSLCDVLKHAAAQPLEFLDLGKKSSFLNLKRLVPRSRKMDRYKLDPTIAKGRAIVNVWEALFQGGKLFYDLVAYDIRWFFPGNE